MNNTDNTNNMNNIDKKAKKGSIALGSAASSFPFASDLFCRHLPEDGSRIRSGQGERLRQKMSSSLCILSVEEFDLR